MLDLTLSGGYLLLNVPALIGSGLELLRKLVNFTIVVPGFLLQSLVFFGKAQYLVSLCENFCLELF